MPPSSSHLGTHLTSANRKPIHLGWYTSHMPFMRNGMHSCTKGGGGRNTGSGRAGSEGCRLSCSLVHGSQQKKTSGHESTAAAAHAVVSREVRRSALQKLPPPFSRPPHTRARPTAATR